MALQEKTRRTTTRDVAAAAGVSQATVSYVLSGREGLSISPVTREKVREAAHRLRYRVNKLAPRVFRGSTGIVGVVIPEVDSSFFASMLHGIQRSSMESDSLTVFSYTCVEPEADRREVDRLLEHRVDGIIIVVSRYTLAGRADWVDSISNEGIPVIMLDDRGYVNRHDCVASDDIGGASTATQHLIDLGHRRIAFVTGAVEHSTQRDRLTGFQQAMERNGRAADAVVIETDWIPATLKSDLRSVMAQPSPPTAIFASSDYLAELVMEILTDLGLQVPRDVSLVGYADTELARGMQLTTVRQDAYMMGRMATQRLHDRLGSPDLKPCEIIVPTSLVVRKSTTGPSN
jgi:LacI family transcriptional regulator